MTLLHIKDPGAVLNYTEDWADELGADTIASAAWTVPTGITKDSDSNTNTTATIVLSGGTAMQTYYVECEITTAAGLKDTRTFIFKCLDR